MEQTNITKDNNVTAAEHASRPVIIPPSHPVKNRRLFPKIFGLVVALLLISGLVSSAYLMGKNQPASIEKQRQTVVQEGEVIANVAEEVGPSVVSIVTSQQSSVNSAYYGTRTRTTQAAGTGLIIDSNGLILTNKHVVAEGITKLEVVTSDGTRYEDVDVIGRDSLNDLAILKVKDPKNFKAAQLADSDNVRTGQKVIAIGNALGQFQNTVTSGIISGLGRPVEAGDESGSATEQLTNLFQTDAAINSGNSGGPLLNYNGEVIGINTAIAADAQNIGFAIPINEAKGIIETVKTTGKLTRAYLGVQYVMLTADSAKELKLSVSQGAYISTDEGSVVSGSPADKAGLKGGDVIVKVGAIKLTDSVSLASAVGRNKVGDTVELTVLRSGKEQKIKVTLSEAPVN
jgi:serine protease Do